VKVGILECGFPPAELVPGFGTYGAMIREMLGPHREYELFDVAAGELPDSADTAAAYILSGSSVGVYDDLPWIPALIRFVRDARGRAGLVGICFGHQAMAQAFGGAVAKSPKGWGLGNQRYDIPSRSPWMDDAAHIDAPASHQDQVVACPVGARVIASSEFTPYAGLDYGDAISFQFHPEFVPGFATGLLESRRERFGISVDAAIASYTGKNDCARVAAWIGRFLDHRAGSK